ncbi:MAG: hypothetical protein ACI9D5_002000 [Candidatus Endobugula sp.]|jgi:hypothetical protein
MSDTQNNIVLNPDDIPIHVKALGTQLLSYILDLPENEIQILIEKGGNITPERAQAIITLQGFTNQIVSQRTRNQVLEDGDLMHMSTAIAQDGHHIFNNIRREIIKKPVIKQYTDPLMQALSQICVECFPVFMLPKKRNNFGFMLIIPHFRGALKKEFCDALLNDPDISGIFPEKEDYMKNSYQIYTSTGRGGGVQICGFYRLLIENSYTLMRMRNKFSVEDLLDSAEENLAMIRKAIRGEKFKVPIILCFKGAWLSSDAVITAFNGTITSLHDGIKDIIYPQGLPPGFNDQKHAGFIYISEVDYKINIMDKMPVNAVGKWPDGLLYDAEKTEEIAKNISFSFLMAINREELISVEKISSFIFDPLIYGNSTSWNMYKNNICTPIEMTEQEGQNIIEWCNTVSKISDAKFLLAKRRLQSALTERENPIDGLIDCVIGLENLFGERSEISFSVAIAASKLLEKDLSKRKETFLDVKKIYGLRSKIIHGGDNILNHDEMMVRRNQAASYLIQCFRKLYLEHEELLQLTSAERSRELALL